MKKVLCLILTVAMLCTVLCSCAGNADDTTKTAKSTQKAESTQTEKTESTKTQYAEAGLYQDGVRVMTWEEVLEKTGYENFDEIAGINSNGSVSYFQDCSGDLVLPDNINAINSLAFSQCFDLTSITIPDSVNYIGEQAFRECVLESIKIPALAKNIHEYAFEFAAVKKYIVSEDNSNYIAVDDVLYNFDQTKIIAYPILKQTSSYTIPNTVTELNFSVFDNCKFKELTIPASVTELTYESHGTVLLEMDWGTIGNLKTIRYKSGSAADTYVNKLCASSSDIKLIEE